MPVVGIFGKAKHPGIENAICALVRLAEVGGHRILVEEQLQLDLAGCERQPSVEVAAQAELAVVLGGDGTMIRAVRLLDERQVPVFGINMGSLGFLTGFSQEEAEDAFARVLDGEYELEERIRLEVGLLRSGQLIACERVFNDAVVSVGDISRIANIRAEVDGKLVATFRADGLIVSTPSGSTAYSMAAGGPIVMPGTRAFVLTPICPHMLTMRPLVLSDEVRVVVEIDDPNPSMFVTFDGQLVERMQPQDRIEISRAPGQVLLVKPPRDQFQILKTKLKWGQR